jgi:hypothetical protein
MFFNKRFVLIICFMKLTDFEKVSEIITLHTIIYEVYTNGNVLQAAANILPFVLQLFNLHTPRQQVDVMRKRNICLGSTLTFSLILKVNCDPFEPLAILSYYSAD